MKPTESATRAEAFTFGSLFSGIGGMDLGLERAGMECRWQVEIDPFCQKVLAKHWPNVTRYGDIRTIDGRELERVDLLAGGFPCQDISVAGQGIGIIGKRSALWSEFARLLGEVRPRFALVENSPALRGKGLALVLQDICSLRFDAEWHCIPASALGAPHERDRIWILAYPEGLFGEAIIRRKPNRDIQALAHADRAGLAQRQSERRHSWQEQPTIERSDDQSYREPLVHAAIARGECSAWTTEPGVVPLVHGVSQRVDKLRALGNAVVPQVVEWIGRRILEAAA